MKSSYYVHVGSGAVLQDPTVFSWEFEIEATEDQAAELREWFEELQSAEMKTAQRATTPILLYHFDAENDVYDGLLIEIYRRIYELGNEKTRTHIESMNILDKKGLHSK